MRFLMIFNLCVLICACPGEVIQEDAGAEMDTGQRDATIVDGATPIADAGAGSETEAGNVEPMDAGVEAADANVALDIGEVLDDAGPIEGTPFSGTVRDFQSRTGVAGVRVCVYQQPEIPCTLSDQDGAYRLTVPPGDLIMIYDQGQSPIIPQLTPLIVGDESFTWNQIVVGEASSAMMFGLWGQENDPTLGSVSVTSFVSPRESDGLQGAVTRMDPASGAGPLYTANGVPSAVASVTDTNGLAAFLNVEPGEAYEASVSKEGWNCVVPSEREPASFPVVAGHLTGVTRRCTQ